ncbi:MAG: hypothetical protein ACFFA4_11150 [Promethearchaeota archaeon]
MFEEEIILSKDSDDLYNEILKRKQKIMIPFLIPQRNNLIGLARTNRLLIAGMASKKIKNHEKRDI